ncbi:MAG: sodium:solute symporter family protein [Methanomassiliicoccales archaeon]|nr:sodium:solute symporter family protein [Methanomassiliicoccales archaeon]
MLPAIVYIIVATYLVVLLAIGLYSARLIKTDIDFMLAGRRLGPILIAGTLAATEVGGGSSMGVAQKAFTNWGLSAAWYVLTMAIVFVILAFLAPKLRSTMIATVPEFFNKRYGKANHILTAIVLLLPMIGLTAIQIMASGIVLSILLGIDFKVAVLIMGAVAVFYSVMGGLWSVTLTDLFQWICVVGGIIIAVPYGLKVIGGWDVLKTTLEPWRFSLTAGIGWETIVSLTVMYFASFTVGQEYIQRYFAARDDKAARNGSLLAAGTYVIFAWFPALLGLIALAYVKMGHTIPYIDQYGTRYVLPGFAAVALPPVLLGILFAALVSATMSSADSDLVAGSAIFVNDIYKPYIRPNATPEELARISKIITAILGIFSIIVAMFKVSVIVDVLMFSFSFRAAGIFVPYLMSHYWDKGSKVGSFLAILVGSLVVGLEALGWVSFGKWGSVIPGIILSFIVFVVFSYLVPDKEPKSFQEVFHT